MLRAIRWLLGLCNHKWELIRHVALLDADKPHDQIGSRTYHKCALCQTVKAKDYT